MTNDLEIKVAFTVLEDGTHLATAISTPLFCVSDESYEAVHAKAQRAIDFWCKNRLAVAPRRETKVTQFAPQRVESLPALVCA